MKSLRITFVVSIFVLFLQCGLSAFAQTSLYPIKQGDKWGLINASGQVVVQPTFDEAKPFSEGMGRVRVKDKWGYVDSTGKLAIKPDFVLANDFSEGMARVNTKGFSLFFPKHDYYIDKQGKTVLKHKSGIEYIAEFSNGLAHVWSDKGGGFVDKTGKLVFVTGFQEAFDFSDGAARVMNGKREMFANEHGLQEWSYVDTSGKLLFSPRKKIHFDDFSEGLAGFAEAAFVFGNGGFIDKAGNTVISLGSGPVTKFSEGVAGVRVTSLSGSKGFSFINKSGTLVFRLTDATEVYEFSNGRARVKIGDKYGFVDHAGAMVIPAQFDEADNFWNGLARVSMKTGSVGYIDPTGKFVWRSN